MKIKITYFVLLTFILGSCNFLDREPLDFGDENAYFKNTNDLANYTNGFYSMLPNVSTWGGGIFTEDNNSDNQTGSFPNSLFYQGDKLTPALWESQWQFTNIRELNYFIQIVSKKRSENMIVGSRQEINHYLGEAYFFKAYDYFRLLSTLGDVPILNEVPDNNEQKLIAMSKRAPRNEVARAILSWCDSAAVNMMKKAPATGRISKDVAFLLKSRVALFEATWEKYHEGTAFVPGNPKWPGSSTYPGFKFPAGSAQAEYNFFFEQAIAAADSVASTRKLYPEYIDMFNDTKGNVVASDEVLVARYFNSSHGHSITHYLLRTGYGTGYTRSLVESFLTTNGLPIYADPTYQGDAVMYYMLENRDKRLVNSVKVAGFVINPLNNKDTLVNYLPRIYITGGQGSPTGYELKKWISYENGQDETVSSGTSAIPMFRAAEAYLNYLEAYYERYGNLGGNCDKYWKALRTRAGVNPDYTITIANTDLSKENDLAVKSGNKYVDKTLYNIRRERRNEFIAEGMRLRDLKRWRALDGMVAYKIEGLNLWDDLYNKYTADQIKEGTVSQRSSGKYINPFRIVATNVVYNGYNFPKAHYLEPIPVSEIILTGGTSSPIYQNPGWPSNTDGLADYSYNFE